MKINVATGILSFCGGVAFAYLLLCWNSDSAGEVKWALVDQTIDGRKVCPDGNAKRRKRLNDQCIHPESTFEVSDSSHDSEGDGNSKEKCISNVVKKVVDKRLVTRDRHTTRTIHVPLKQEYTNETTVKSGRAIGGWTVVRTGDDLGIDSGSDEIIDDPVNPQPGMILRAYHLNRFMDTELLTDSVTKLPTLAAATAMVDKGEDFSLKQIGKSEANAGMWTGFIKCKRSGVYTFTLTQPSKAVRGTASGGYSFWVNGKSVVGAGWRETSVDVDLKVGWNKMDIVCQFGSAPALTIAYKPKDSTADPRPLTPAMMFFDKKPEDD